MLRPLWNMDPNISERTSFVSGSASLALSSSFYCFLFSFSVSLSYPFQVLLTRFVLVTSCSSIIKIMKFRSNKCLLVSKYFGFIPRKPLTPTIKSCRGRYAFFSIFSSSLCCPTSRNFEPITIIIVLYMGLLYS